MVGPIIRRGVDNAIWELEYMVNECNAKLCKVYAPEDLGALDDKRLWPFYEKACELDIALTVHTGMSYVCPQPSKFTHPDLLDDMCLDFPELKIIGRIQRVGPSPENNTQSQQCKKNLSSQSSVPAK